MQLIIVESPKKAKTNKNQTNKKSNKTLKEKEER